MNHVAGVIAGALLYAYGAAAQPASAPPVRIGVVIDGPWERNAEVEGLFQREILDLVRGEFDVVFPETARIVGDWTVSTVESSLDRLLADPNVDIVLAMGIVASDRAFRRQELDKPLIAPFVIDAEIQGAPREGAASGVARLNYLGSSITIERDLEVFQRLRPFKNLVILHGPALNDVPGIRARLEQVVSGFDVELTLVEVRERADEALPLIPTETDAVIVNPLLQLEEGELEKIAQGLIERGLPSFSRIGRSEVERGLLMSLTENIFDRRTRRVALNVQRILLGEDPGTFAVDFIMREELVVNMTTARAINVYPNFALETVAELVDNDLTRPVQARRLNIERVADDAVAANRDFVAFDAGVAAGAQNIPIARSQLLPRLDFVTQASAIDGDRAEATGAAQYLLSPGLTLTQLLYSDPAWANKTFQENLQRALEHERETLRLDIMQQATTTYLDVMRTLTSERIQRENLGLTRSNLELAQVRAAIGASGPSEVYRWEAQLAADQSRVIQASAQRNLAEIALNRLLHRPLEEAFTTDEVGVDDPMFLHVRAQFYPYISSRAYFDITRDAFALIGLSQAPELMAIDAAIAAQQRSLTSAGRAFYVPDVFFQGSIDHQFRGGAGGLGAFQSLGALFPELELTPPNGTNWSLGIDVSLPLFTSGERPAVRRQDQQALSELRFQREALAERIEQRVRSGLHEAGASYAGIQLARDAAEASDRNLDLVTDSYSRGAVSILDLLDAQNAAVLSEQSAATAVYDFLIDMLEVERSIGKFYFRTDPMELEVLFERVDEVFLERGRQPPLRMR